MSFLKASLFIIGMSSSVFSQDIALVTEAQLAQEIQEIQIDQCSKAIFDILNRYRLDYDIDQFISGARKVRKQKSYIGKDRLLNKINRYVKYQQPIKMFLPGFPFKSPSRSSTISEVPDMAERVALEQLNKLTEEIKVIYPPGAEITILADGQLFSDIFKIPDETVLTYEKALKKLSADLEGIRVLSFSDYLKVQTPENVRKLADKIVPTNLEQAKEVAYKDFTYFRAVCAKIVPRIPNARRNEITMAALKFIERHIKLAHIIKEMHPNKIRLSVHMQQDISEKLGLMLCNGATATPWFGVLVVERDGSKRIVIHDDVDKNQYQFATKMINGIPCLFYQYKDKENNRIFATP